MAAEYGFVAPSGVICANPEKIALVREFQVETAAGMYAGRLVKRGTTDAEVVVNDTSDNSACVGWLGFEQASMDDRPDTIDTIWTVDKSAPVLNGPGMVICAAICGGAQNSVVVGQKMTPASYYGALDKMRYGSSLTSGAAATAPNHHAVAIALQTYNASAVPRTTTADIWVMSLI